MSDFSRNVKNLMEFNKDKGGNLYEVEPMGGKPTAMSWMNKSDVSDKKEAREIDFRQMNGMKLYAKFERIGEKSFWKTYIVSMGHVEIVYVETSDLNPIGPYRP